MVTHPKTPKPHHKNMLPSFLHEEAQGLVDYLTHFPFETPQTCYYCESKHIEIAYESKGIKYCRCLSCKKGFNQLTGTPLATMWYPDKWGDFAAWRLSGLSLKKVGQNVGLLHSAAKLRDKRLLLIMQKRTPALYQWWINHQNREDLSMSALVFEQKKQFKAWLSQIINQKERPCPKCHTPSGRLINAVINTDRPQFICRNCEAPFNPLVGTPFYKMHFIERWLPYFEMMTDGLSHTVISKEIGISRRSLIEWKQNFLAQMDVMGFDALSQWIRWQNSRYSFKNSQNAKLKKNKLI